MVECFIKKMFLCILICCSNKISAQDFNTLLINDSLKINANAVVRIDNLEVIIKSISKAIVKHKYAITILNEAGASFAAYENYYTKLQSLSNIDGHLYDATGKEIRSLKKKDISDFSAQGDMSLMTDVRYKRHNFYWSQYPYTVMYEDEQELDGIFFLPSWHPINTHCAVEESSFSVQTPIDYNLRYKQIAYAGFAKITNTKEGPLYNWQVKNCVAIEGEPYQPNWDEINTAVYIAPSQFEIDKNKGEMDSWLALGKFIHLLNANRQTLPDNVKTDIHKLTDKITNTKEKINILYENLQKNNRYISIQIGIGSWQPVAAADVATKKYGDCKALSNYMVSILNEANIPAKYVLVKAGENKKGLWEDFSANYFNHAIVCVPLQYDSVWLECTSQTESPGYMGSFTGNRKALLIDEDGGHVVNTPTYVAKNNIQIRKINATINSEGELSAKIFTHATGIKQEEAHNIMYGATPEQKKKYLNTILNLPTYTVAKFDYKETKGCIPSIDETLYIVAPFYASVSGKRMFVTANFLNNSNVKLSDEKTRKYDFSFSPAYIDIDSIEIKIPSGYSIESIPKPVTLKTAYGSYSISFNINDNLITVLRKNERVIGRFPKTAFEDISTFFNEIYKADRGKIVMIKKE